MTLQTPTTFDTSTSFVVLLESYQHLKD